MSTQVGSIHYGLSIDSGKFDSQIKSVSNKINQVGSEIEGNTSFQKGFDKLAGIAKVGGLAIASGIAAAGAGLTALTTKMLLSGAELEQQLGGAEAVFGEYASNIKQLAEDAFASAGLSQAEFLQGANKMGSLFQGAGFSVEESMNMSADSMQRASDIASIMGIETTSALEAVAGMAKGNFTMMDNLGVAMNDGAIGAYALSKGINKSTAEMSIQEKVGLAQQMFMEKTAKYAGNYAKENQTLAGSINTTRKAFDNFMAGTGDINDLFEMVINTIQLAVPQIVKIIPGLISGIAILFKGIMQAIPEVLPTLLPVLLTAIKDLLTSLVSALPSIVRIIVNALPLFINAFIQIFMAVAKALPEIITILAQAIPQVIDTIVEALYNPDTMKTMITAGVNLLLALIQAIPLIINPLIQALPVIIENIKTLMTSPDFRSQMLNATVILFRELIKAIWLIIRELPPALWSIIRSIWDYFANARQTMLDAGRNLIGGFIDGIRQRLEDAKQVVRNGLASLRRLLPFSPAKEGPFSGKGWTLYSGQSLMQGFADGIKKNSQLPQLALNGALSGAQLQLNGMAGGNTSTTNNSVNINGDITLGDQSAVGAFFNKLTRNNELAQKGMALQ